ncbi:transmembrane proteins 14C [Carex rostrata]
MLTSLSLHSSILPCFPFYSVSSQCLGSHRLSTGHLSLTTRIDKTVRTRAQRHRCHANLLADFAPTASAAYGTLLLGGGLFAYLRSGSKGSIFGGLSGGALMAAAYYLIQSAETKGAGDAIGFGSAFLFACVFGIRLYNTKKLVPSGLLLALSIGALTVFFSAYMQDKI